jgi:hypothetical protein
MEDGGQHGIYAKDARNREGSWIVKTIDETNADLHQGGFVGEGGFYVRRWTGHRGQVCKGHAHWIDHVGNLVSGQVRIRWRNPDTGEEGIVEMLVPSKICVRAERWHQIEALTDGVIWECWFAAAEADRVYGSRDAVPWHLEK